MRERNGRHAAVLPMNPAQDTLTPSVPGRAVNRADAIKSYTSSLCSGVHHDQCEGGYFGLIAARFLQHGLRLTLGRPRPNLPTPLALLGCKDPTSSGRAITLDRRRCTGNRPHRSLLHPSSCTRGPGRSLTPKRAFSYGVLGQASFAIVCPVKSAFHEPGQKLRAKRVQSSCHLLLSSSSGPVIRGRTVMRRIR